jgi:hypothetical protein
MAPFFAINIPVRCTLNIVGHIVCYKDNGAMHLELSYVILYTIKMVGAMHLKFLIGTLFCHKY